MQIQHHACLDRMPCHAMQAWDKEGGGDVQSKRSEACAGPLGPSLPAQPCWGRAACAHPATQLASLCAKSMRTGCGSGPGHTHMSDPTCAPRMGRNPHGGCACRATEAQPLAHASATVSRACSWLRLLCCVGRGAGDAARLPYDCRNPADPPWESFPAAHARRRACLPQAARPVCEHAPLHACHAPLYSHASSFAQHTLTSAFDPPTCYLVACPPLPLPMRKPAHSPCHSRGAVTAGFRPAPAAPGLRGRAPAHTRE